METTAETKEKGMEFSIKLIRGQKGKYGWEIRVVGTNAEEVMTMCESLNERARERVLKQTQLEIEE